MTEQVTVCLRPSEGVQLFHLHNNEVGSEVFDRVCLPSTCAHVLMDSVLHYFADPGLSQRPQLQRNRAGSKTIVCPHLSDYSEIVPPDSNSFYLESSGLQIGWVNK